MTMYRHKKTKLYITFDDIITKYLYTQNSVDILLPKSTINIIKKLSKNYEIKIITDLNILIIEKTLIINKLTKLNKNRDLCTTLHKGKKPCNPTVRYDFLFSFLQPIWNRLNICKPYAAWNKQCLMKH